MQEFSCGAVSQGSSIVNAVAKVGSLAQKLLHAVGAAKKNYIHTHIHTHIHNGVSFSH